MSGNDFTHGHEDTYRKVYDHVADSILIHDKATHRFLDCNRSALDRYGYSLDELRQMTPFDLHPVDEFDLVADRIGTRNVDAPNVYRHCTKDGQILDVEILSEEVEYEGTPAWLSIVRDITERKRAEAVIAESRDEALAASKAKSEFVADVSHELRTPMNGVMGMAALLLETSLTEEQQEYAQTITHAADAMLNLLNEILDLSKIEAGKLEIEPIPFNLYESLESVHRLLQLRAQDSGIDLHFHFSDDVPHEVVGDPTRLRQVVTNLAGNAIKFTTEGHVAIRVEGQPVGDDRASLQISVEDTGIGIPEEKLEEIFEKFSQAELSTTRNYGGTGLGLAISQRLVELMGGRLRVSSRKDEGSTFWFGLDLPLARRQGSTQGDAAVLIAHADASVRHRIQQECERAQLFARTVNSSADALDLLDEGHRFSLAIIDFFLPDLDGETLGRFIHNNPEQSHLNPVLLTSSEMTIDPEHAKDAGFLSVLPRDPSSSDLEPWLSPLRSEANVEPESEAPVVPATPPQGPQVLVVEDNPVNQKVVMHVLRRLGCEIDLAEDGSEALARVTTRATRYDLILMDCQMPVMDGYEATGKIRQLGPDKAQTPIVALTANAMDGDREKCLRAGMDDYMSKPATSDQIKAMLEKWATVPTA